SGVSDGEFGRQFTPVISVSGEHITATDIRLNGQAFVSGTAVTADGQYTLTATASNAAGSDSKSVSFVVDTLAPVISISGVADGGLDKRFVPIVAVSDLNLLSSAITLNGQPFVSGTAVGADGHYILAVSARDRAGNTGTQTVSFEVDATPPVISIGGVQAGAVVNKAVTPVIDVTDANPAGRNITLNGQAFASGTAVAAEGEYQLLVTATDGAGNSAQRSIGFTIDLTPPTVAILSPDNGASIAEPSVDIVGYTEAGATVFLSGPGAQEIPVLADTTGRFIFASVALAGGENRFSLHSTDRAGNTGPDTQLTVFGSGAGHSMQLNGALINDIRVLIWMPDNGPGEPSALEQLLVSTLGAHGIRYWIVNDELEFRKELYSQLYTVVFIGDLKAKPVKLNKKLVDDLKTNIAGGTGLVVVKPVRGIGGIINRILKKVIDLRHIEPGCKPSANSSIWDALDLDAESGFLQYADRKWQSLFDSCGLIIDQYVDGKAIIAGFNPADLEQPAGQEWILRMLSTAVADRIPTIPGAVTGVRWTLDNVEPPLTVRLAQEVSEPMRIMGVTGGRIIDDRNAEWFRTVTTPQSLFDSLVRLPEQKGSYPVSTDVFDEAGGATPVLSAELDVRLDADLGDLGAALMNTLQTLKKGDKKHDRKLDDLIKTARDVVELNVDTRQEAEWAISRLINVYKTVETDWQLPDALRQIAGLIKAYEIVWYRLAYGANTAPSITLLEPARDIHNAANIWIRWSDFDRDSRARISLFYDTDNRGGDGKLIAANIEEEPEGEKDRYKWNIAGLAPGTYYVYAVISDETSSAIAYAPGTVTK
ncbi:MAG TPA: Ig-like domain-containing protein, partial [Gammaproteobacteria bacterium]|nr:Ig-like domain-containing protein [Gammaproteobacteria bacterium]